MYKYFRSKQIISVIVRKALISILVGAFLFNDIAYAADFQNLARPGLQDPVVMARINDAYKLVSTVKAIDSVVEDARKIDLEKFALGLMTTASIATGIFGAIGIAGYLLETCTLLGAVYMGIVAIPAAFLGGAGVGLAASYALIATVAEASNIIKQFFRDSVSGNGAATGGQSGDIYASMFGPGPLVGLIKKLVAVIKAKILAKTANYEKRAERRRHLERAKPYLSRISYKQLTRMLDDEARFDYTLVDFLWQEIALKIGRYSPTGISGDEPIPGYEIAGMPYLLVRDTQTLDDALNILRELIEGFDSQKGNIVAQLQSIRENMQPGEFKDLFRQLHSVTTFDQLDDFSIIFNISLRKQVLKTLGIEKPDPAILYSRPIEFDDRVVELHELNVSQLISFLHTENSKNRDSDHLSEGNGGSAAGQVAGLGVMPFSRHNLIGVPAAKYLKSLLGPFGAMFGLWAASPDNPDTPADKSQAMRREFIPSFIATPLEEDAWLSLLNKLFEIRVSTESLHEFTRRVEEAWEDAGMRSQVTKAIELISLPSYSGALSIIANIMMSEPVDDWLSFLSNEGLFRITNKVAGHISKMRGETDPWEKIVHTGVVEDPVGIDRRYSLRMPRNFFGEGDYNVFGRHVHSFVRTSSANAASENILSASLESLEALKKRPLESAPNFFTLPESDIPDRGIDYINRILYGLPRVDAECRETISRNMVYSHDITTLGLCSPREMLLSIPAFFIASRDSAVTIQKMLRSNFKVINMPGIMKALFYGTTDSRAESAPETMSLLTLGNKTIQLMSSALEHARQLTARTKAFGYDGVSFAFYNGSVKDIKLTAVDREGNDICVSLYDFNSERWTDYWEDESRMVDRTSGKTTISLPKVFLPERRLSKAGARIFDAANRLVASYAAGISDPNRPFHIYIGTEDELSMEMAIRNLQDPFASIAECPNTNSLLLLSIDAGEHKPDTKIPLFLLGYEDAFDSICTLLEKGKSLPNILKYFNERYVNEENIDRLRQELNDAAAKAVQSSSAGPAAGGIGVMPFSRHNLIGVPAAKYLKSLLGPFGAMFGLWAASNDRMGSSDNASINDDEEVQSRAEDPIFLSLMEVTKHEGNAAWNQTPNMGLDKIKKFLATQDSHIVARVFYKYFDSLDQIDWLISKEGPQFIFEYCQGDFLFSETFPEKYEMDIVEAVRRSYAMRAKSDKKVHLKDYSLKLETAILELLLDLKTEVITEFLSIIERENCDPKRPLVQKIKQLLLGGAKWQTLIDVITQYGRDNPVIAYGPQTFKAFAARIANVFEGFDEMPTHRLIKEIGKDDERTFSALVFIIENLRRLGFKENDLYYPEKLNAMFYYNDAYEYVEGLERALDSSNDPFVLRAAIDLYVRIGNIDKHTKNSRLMRLCMKAVENVQDIDTRCWLIENLMLSEINIRSFTAGLSKLIGNRVAESEIVRRINDDNLAWGGTKNNTFDLNRKLMLDILEIILHPDRYAEKRKARETFIELLHFLNGKWWLVEEDKARLGIDLFHHTIDIGIIFTWSDYEFCGKDNPGNKLNAVKQIIENRIRAGNLQHLSLDEQKKMFELMSKLGINEGFETYTSMSGFTFGNASIMPVMLQASSTADIFALAGILACVYIIAHRKKMLEWFAIISNKLKPCFTREKLSFFLRIIAIPAILCSVNYLTELSLLNKLNEALIVVDSAGLIDPARQYYSAWAEWFGGPIQYAIEGETVKYVIPTISFINSAYLYIAASLCFPILLYACFSYAIKHYNFQKYKSIYGAAFHLIFYGLILNIADVFLWHGVFDYMFFRSPGDFLMIFGVSIMAIVNVKIIYDAGLYRMLYNTTRSQNGFQIAAFDDLLKGDWTRDELIGELIEINIGIYGEDETAELSEREILRRYYEECAANDEILVALDGTKIVGSVIAKLKSEMVEASDLVVKPDYQSEGIGTQLMNSLVDRATERGVGLLSISATEDDVNGVRSSIGFHEEYFADNNFEVISRTRRKSVKSAGQRLVEFLVRISGKKSVATEEPRFNRRALLALPLFGVASNILSALNVNDAEKAIRAKIDDQTKGKVSDIADRVYDALFILFRERTKSERFNQIDKVIISKTSEDSVRIRVIKNSEYAEPSPAFRNGIVSQTQESAEEELRELIEDNILGRTSFWNLKSLRYYTKVIAIGFFAAMLCIPFVIIWLAGRREHARNVANQLWKKSLKPRPAINRRGASPLFTEALPAAIVKAAKFAKPSDRHADEKPFDPNESSKRYATGRGGKDKSLGGELSNTSRTITEENVIESFRQGASFIWVHSTSPAKLRILQELARLLGKEPGALSKDDFKIHMQAFKGKNLLTLLFWAIKYFGEPDKDKALKKLKAYLGIEDTTQVAANNPWDNISKKRLRTMVVSFAERYDLRRLPSWLTVGLFGTNSVPEFNGNTPASLLEWAQAKFGSDTPEDALEKLKKHLNFKGLPDVPPLNLTYTDWDTTRTILKKYDRCNELPNEAAINYIVNNKIENDDIDALVMDAKKGNWASYCVLEKFSDNFCAYLAKIYLHALDGHEINKMEFFQFQHGKILRACIKLFDPSKKIRFKTYLGESFKFRFLTFKKDVERSMELGDSNTSEGEQLRTRQVLIDSVSSRIDTEEGPQTDKPVLSDMQKTTLISLLMSRALRAERNAYRDAAIFEACVFNKCTDNELSARFHLSRQRINGIIHEVYRAIAVDPILKHAFKEAGIDIDRKFSGSDVKKSFSTQSDFVDIRVALQKLHKQGFSYNKISKMTGVSAATVLSIIQGKTAKLLGKTHRALLKSLPELNRVNNEYKKTVQPVKKISAPLRKHIEEVMAKRPQDEGDMPPTGLEPLPRATPSSEINRDVTHLNENEKSLFMAAPAEQNAIKTEQVSGQLPIMLVDTNQLSDFKRFVFRKGTAYGSGWNWVSGEPYDANPRLAGVRHTGVDIIEYETKSGDIRPIPEGTELKSIVSGRVIYGKREKSEEVFIETSEGMIVTYGHVFPSVAPGTEVKKGDVIAIFHQSNFVNISPHLHLEAAKISAGDFALPVRSNFNNEDEYYTAIVKWQSELADMHSIDPFLVWPDLAANVLIAPDDTVTNGPFFQADTSRGAAAAGEAENTEVAPKAPKGLVGPAMIYMPLPVLQWIDRCIEWLADWLKTFAIRFMFKLGYLKSIDTIETELDERFNKLLDVLEYLKTNWSKGISQYDFDRKIKPCREELETLCWSFARNSRIYTIDSGTKQKYERLYRRVIAAEDAFFFIDQCLPGSMMRLNQLHDEFNKLTTSVNTQYSNQPLSNVQLEKMRASLDAIIRMVMEECEEMRLKIAIPIFNIDHALWDKRTKELEERAHVSRERIKYLDGTSLVGEGLILLNRLYGSSEALHKDLVHAIIERDIEGLKSAAQPPVGRAPRIAKDWKPGEPHYAKDPRSIPSQDQGDMLPNNSEPLPRATPSSGEQTSGELALGLTGLGNPADPYALWLLNHVREMLDDVKTGIVELQREADEEVNSTVDVELTAVGRVIYSGETLLFDIFDAGSVEEVRGRLKALDEIASTLKTGSEDRKHSPGGLVILEAAKELSKRNSAYVFFHEWEDYFEDQIRRKYEKVIGVPRYDTGEIEADKRYYIWHEVTKREGAKFTRQVSRNRRIDNKLTAESAAEFIEFLPAYKHSLNYYYEAVLNLPVSMIEYLYSMQNSAVSKIIGWNFDKNDPSYAEYLEGMEQSKFIKRVVDGEPDAVRQAQLAVNGDIGANSGSVTPIQSEISDEPNLHSGTNNKNMSSEMSKLHTIDSVYKNIAEGRFGPEKCAIKIWSGYTGLGQKSLLTRIKNWSKGQVSFENDMEKLVEFACRAENLNNHTVTILPRQKELLTTNQARRLKKAGARVIYINTDKDIGTIDLGQLQGIIGIGKAYIYDDEDSFYRLYGLLAKEPTSNHIALEDLKNNPIKFIRRLNFYIKPIVPQDSADRERLERCQEALLRAA